MGKRKEDTVPYTYFIKWTNLNKWYYGVRYAKGCSPKEFWIKYFTSSSHVKNLLKEYGNPDIIQIRKTFKSAEKAVLWEKNVLLKMNVLHREDSLNMNIAGSIMIPHKTYMQIAENRKNKYGLYNGDVCGNKNPMFNKKWITNGIESRVINKSDIIPDGWHPGRKIKASQNTVWINNGIKNKKIKSKSNIPDGWQLGMAINNYGVN